MYTHASDNADGISMRPHFKSAINGQYNVICYSIKLTELIKNYLFIKIGIT